MSDLDILYQPTTLGRMTLKNRFIQSPMHTLFATGFGEVSQKLIDYMVARARGGVSMIILENTAVDWNVGRANGNPVRIDRDVFISGLSDLAEAVHREGVKISVQLHHAGRQNPKGNTEGNVGPVAPSAIASTAIGDVPRELTVEDIEGIVRQFADGARRAVQAGFDMVEIHGSHGYLLTQFLSPQSNHRTDEYGGSFENRARFPLQVVKAVREAVGEDFPVSFRMSVEERTPGGMPAEEGVAFCKLIEDDVDVFNITVGTYESMDSIFMMQGVDPAQLLPLAAQVKAATGKPVIGISRLGWALEESARAVEAGDLDFVSMARTQLADPELVNKVGTGQADRVRLCIACNECVGGFLFNGWRVHCVINPELGYEGTTARLLQPQDRRRNVLVVGGGPAGFEAARAAARRGHQVRLLEARPRIGGNVLAAAAVNYKQREMEAYVRYLENELAHLGVTVEVNTEFGPAHPALEGSDVVILATGAVPSSTDYTALDAVAVLMSGDLPAGNVVVHGANEIGLNAAAYAVQNGRDTLVVTGSQQPGYDMNDLLSAHTVSLLGKMGVRFAAEDDRGPDAVRLWAPDWIADDTAWDLSGVDVISVGAKVKGGRLFEATQSGFWAGSRL